MCFLLMQALKKKCQVRGCEFQVVVLNITGFASVTDGDLLTLARKQVCAKHLKEHKENWQKYKGIAGRRRGVNGISFKSGFLFLYLYLCCMGWEGFCLFFFVLCFSVGSG